MASNTAQTIVDVSNVLSLAEQGLIQAVKLYAIISANASGAKTAQQILDDALATFTAGSAEADAEIKANS